MSFPNYPNAAKVRKHRVFWHIAYHVIMTWRDRQRIQNHREKGSMCFSLEYICAWAMRFSPLLQQKHNGIRHIARQQCPTRGARQLAALQAAKSYSSQLGQIVCMCVSAVIVYYLASVRWTVIEWWWSCFLRIFRFILNASLSRKFR